MYLLLVIVCAHRVQILVVATHAIEAFTCVDHSPAQYQH